MSQCIPLYTHLYINMHTHTHLQLQTTSKENAGKNVVSLITRNRITVCKCVYIALRNLVVNVCAHTPTHAHTHTHTHILHLSSKSWVSMAKGSAQKLSLEVSVCMLLWDWGRGEGGLHAVLVTLGCHWINFSSSFDRKGTWWNQGKNIAQCWYNVEWWPHDGLYHVLSTLYHS